MLGVFWEGHRIQHCGRVTSVGRRWEMSLPRDRGPGNEQGCCLCTSAVNAPYFPKSEAQPVCTFSREDPGFPPVGRGGTATGEGGGPRGDSQKVSPSQGTGAPGQNCPGKAVGDTLAFLQCVG